MQTLDLTLRHLCKILVDLVHLGKIFPDAHFGVLQVRFRLQILQIDPNLNEDFQQKEWDLEELLLISSLNHVRAL